MKKQKLIGRGNELETLKQLERSKNAEFLAVYGRRRVGKTFLIRQFFSGRRVCYMETAGLKDAPIDQQIENFASALSKVFFNDLPIRSPRSWKEAFTLFTEQLIKIPKHKKVVLFLDELPWLATKKSGLIQALDYFWNMHWSKCSNFLLIVCGSAASWMLDHLIYAKGGLHNRLTKRILLEPFSLKETEMFLKSQQIRLSQKQILDLYMAIGGVPYYLKEVKKGRSATQTIDELCFTKSGLLYNEFEQLFQALFDQADVNLRIVQEIVKAGNVISRQELVKALDNNSGSALNRRLRELEASGFIQCFVPYGKKKRDRFYRIVDEYTIFYIKWIAPITASGMRLQKSGYWSKMTGTPARLSWAGYAFESVCFKHIDQISDALGLSKVAFNAGSWRYVPPKGSKDAGAQIDLLFDREDGVITVCEIKYSDKLFCLDKECAKSLVKKLDTFETRTKSKKELFLSMITTKGIRDNLWSEDLIESEVVLEDLYE